MSLISCAFGEICLLLSSSLSPVKDIERRKEIEVTRKAGEIDRKKRGKL
jgi:hypothetical protein